MLWTTIFLKKNMLRSPWPVLFACTRLLLCTMSQGTPSPASPGSLLECLLQHYEPEKVFTSKHNADMYERLRFSRNLRISNFPSAIVLPQGTSQVSQGVKCANERSLNICARSGRHSYEGYSTCDGGLLVDLREMDELYMSPTSDIAAVGAGISNGKLNYWMWMRHKRVLPTGSCSSVGLGGIILGAGIGHLSRHFGMLADNLESLTMVDYKGDVHYASQGVNEDLFWASRGGGGGQFGIATEFRLKTFKHKNDGRVTWLKLAWSFDQFHDVFEWWMDESFLAPEKLFLQLYLDANVQQVQMTIHFSGEKDELEGWFDSNCLSNILPTLKKDYETVDFVTSLLDADGQDRGNASILYLPNHYKNPFKHVSVMGYEVMSNGLLDQLKAHFLAAPQLNEEGAGRFFLSDAYGGAIVNLANNATAFPHRQGVRYMIQFGTWWQPDSPQKVIDDQLKWQKDLQSLLRTELYGAYTNYIDSDLDNYMQEYFMENVPRLQRVKQKYDPHNVFSFEQSIKV